MTSGDAAVCLDGIDAHRGSRLALRDLSVSVPAGSAVAVIGPNGAGKSTMFAVVSGRLAPSRGTVSVGGPVADVLQATAIDEQVRLTVEDVVRMGRYPSLGLLRPMRRPDRHIVDEAVARVGLEELRRRPIDELSGGQRQRVLVAQGLAQEAPILLLDEPATGLDVPSRQRILEVIRTETRRGRTVLYSTHDLADTAGADLVIALACSCVCCAPPDVALDSPQVADLFRAPGLREHPPSAAPAESAVQGS